MFMESKFKKACSKMLAVTLLGMAVAMPVYAEEAAEVTVAVQVETAVTTTSAVATTSSQVKFTIGKKAYTKDGVEMAMDAAPMIKEGKTMLPVKYVATALDADVKFDGATKEVAITTVDGTVVVLKINASTAKVNGTVTELGAKAIVEEGRTYVPVASIARILGAEVKWDNATKTATFN